MSTQNGITQNALATIPRHPSVAEANLHLYVRSCPNDPGCGFAHDCTAHRVGSDGKVPCNRRSIQGGTVCPSHGGATAHVRSAAAARLAHLTEPAVERLQDLLESARAADALGAVNTVLKYGLDEGLLDVNAALLEDPDLFDGPAFYRAHPTKLAELAGWLGSDEGMEVTAGAGIKADG